MDHVQILFAIAVGIIALIRWLVENRESFGSGNKDGKSDLPEWTWPEEELIPPPPPLRQNAPPPVPATPSTPQPASHGTALARMEVKLEEARRKHAAAILLKEQTIAKSRKTPIVARQHGASSSHGAGWLRDKEALKRAIIAREILGPPVALRDSPLTDIR